MEKKTKFRFNRNIFLKKPIKNDWLIYTKDLSVCPTLTSFSSSKKYFIY